MSKLEKQLSHRLKVFILCFLCGLVVEYCVSCAKVVGLIPREHVLMKIFNLNAIVSRFG